MSELLPTRQATDLRRAIIDYVTTTIGLADKSAEAQLGSFLGNADEGIFTGPYVRSRMPFVAAPAAAPGSEPLTTLPSWFTPYAHQAAAFERLSTNPNRPGGQLDNNGLRIPKPTLVTTGTGSGKTESFLYPVLDYVVRAKERGVGGIKALILYPMNALANDQAGRLARLIASNDHYRGITAALYTGEASETPRTTMSAEGLITERATIRSSAPDLVLTNYKMLDQLLLRRADRGLWDASAESLRYIVLDEFHTYDGAQGTDVAMLLRRLRLVLETKSPRGVHLIPVATSATLGESDGPEAGHDSAPGSMLGFARTVFGNLTDGTQIGPDAIVGEQRLTLEEFSAPILSRVQQYNADAEAHGLMPLDPLPITAATLRPVAREHLAPNAATTPEDLAHAMLTLLWGKEWDNDAVAKLAERGLGLPELLIAHPATQRALEASAIATHLGDIARHAFPGLAAGSGTPGSQSGFAGLPASAHETAATLLFAALGHARATYTGETGGRNAYPTFETHLWIRELSRINREVSTAPAFRWAEGTGSATPLEDNALVLPAIYCRHCGRSGWAANEDTVGAPLTTDPVRIRRSSLHKRENFRPLLLDNVGAASGSAEEPRGGEVAEAGRRRYFDLTTFILQNDSPGEEELQEGRCVPVLTYTEGTTNIADAVENTRCPACGKDEGIRFLASRIATLLSVSLTSLFGARALDGSEKKALVFTDSVQDAAHRAAFVEARSHALTLRSAIGAQLTAEGTSLVELADRMIAAATNGAERYRLLHPTITGTLRLMPFWLEHEPGEGRKYTKAERDRALGYALRRVRFDLAVEFGLQANVGRTLLTTASATASVEVSDEELDRIVGAVWNSVGTGLQDMLRTNIAAENGTRIREGEVPEGLLRLWVRGVLERMRLRGAISHEWLAKFRSEGGKLIRLWHLRPDKDLMPAFPAGRIKPGLPAFGVLDPRSLFESINARGSWYRDWGRRVFHIDSASAAALLPPLFAALEAEGIIDAVTIGSRSTKKTTSYALDPARIVVEAADAEGSEPLYCPECSDTTFVRETLAKKLEGGPCLRAYCGGRLRRTEEAPSYYTTMYRANMRRVIAREHTSILETEERLRYEHQFKESATTPGAPNVLVATPTLEMGIDIGDLSTVMLASPPRTVASYLQRVGRAGRLTGNSLDITFLPARGQGGPYASEPLRMINGAVRAPGAYLSAEEILRRQYLAYLMDTLAGDLSVDTPPKRKNILASVGPDSFLGAVIRENQRHGTEHVERFLGTFERSEKAWRGLTEEAADGLRDWALGIKGDDGARDATDLGLTRAINNAAERWGRECDDLQRRKHRVAEQIDALQGRTDEEALKELARHRGENELLALQEAALYSAEEHKAAVLEALKAERESEERRLGAAKRRIDGEIASIASDHWIGVLERFGLLPNFTLVDDAVSIDATLIWQDGDEWRYESADYQRGGAAALTELAPRAHFYVHGKNLEIDAIDLGTQQHLLKRIAFCPKCGTQVELGGDAPLLQCPTCNGLEITDTSQHLNVVDLTRVYSTMEHSSALINDTEDERTKGSDDIALTYSMAEADHRTSWHHEATGLGFAFYRNAHLTRLNLGTAWDAAPEIILAGESRRIGGFLVCSECGHVDSKADDKKTSEHQLWCSLRKAPREKTTSIVLSRSQRTEAAIMTLPHMVMDPADHGELATFRAAFRLGVEHMFGGSIANFDIDEIAEPGAAGSKALLLSDSIPGGTGYLAELSSPDGVRRIIQHAIHALDTCPCQDENLKACPRCLLQYLRDSETETATRTRALEMMMALQPESDWAVNEASRPASTGSRGPGTSGFNADSTLEKRLREVLVDYWRSLPGAHVEKRSAASGDIVYVHYQGRKFTMRTRVRGPVSEPDFELTWSGSPVEGIAIFADGKQFHATADKNRLADDAYKRTERRESGWAVYSVTYADVEQFAAWCDAGALDLADASVDRTALPHAPLDFASHQVLCYYKDKGQLTTADLAFLHAGPLAQIARAVTDPQLEQHARIAKLATFFLHTDGVQTHIIGGRKELAARTLTTFTNPSALRDLIAPSIPGVSGMSGYNVGPFSAYSVKISPSSEYGTIIALDDTAEGLNHPDFDHAWRMWLQASNLAQDPLAKDGTGTVMSPMTMTTRSLLAEILAPAQEAHVGNETSGTERFLERTLDTGTTAHAATPATPVDIVPAPAITLTGPWARLAAGAYDDTESALITGLFANDFPLPIQGGEFAGVMADLAWPDLKIMWIAAPLDDNTRATLTDDHWRVVDGDTTEPLPALIALRNEDA